MNTTAILIVVLFLALIWFVTNALLAAGLFNSKKEEFQNRFSGRDKSMEELRKRVEELKNTDKKD